MTLPEYSNVFLDPDKPVKTKLASVKNTDISIQLFQKQKNDNDKQQVSRVEICKKKIDKQVFSKNYGS